MVRADAGAAFLYAFEAGDKLTEARFDAARGVGANVGEGRIFTRFPRADLADAGEWISHFPRREGGPDATSCIACHNAPLANGAGDVALNVVVDPGHTDDPARYLERNTLPLFALGAPQGLAEEMTSEMHAQRTRLSALTCESGEASGPLSAKGVTFGTLSIHRVVQVLCEVENDTTGVQGINADLVVRPFGWKGTHTTIRAFSRDAAHNELGLPEVELVGQQDGDFDGVTGELSVGDLKALVIYMAALERPASTLELAEIGLAEVSGEERQRIVKGEALFRSVACSGSHVPEMELADPVFAEPAEPAPYRDASFPSGVAPVGTGLIQEAAVQFDLTADQPNNQFETAARRIRLGAFARTSTGGAKVAWFTNFKRHDMGPDLADPDVPLGIPAEMWPTRSLAGGGSTGPWLHDGRATTLEEAILAHGGEAAASRDAFAALAGPDQAAIVAFLESLVIYAPQDEDAH